MQEFRLPDPGEGLTEATITSWKVAEGDQVKVNDIIVEIETAKSLVELPTPWTGTVAKVLVAEGTEVEVGTPIIVIDDGSGGSVPTSAPAAEAAPAVAAPAVQASAEPAPQAGSAPAAPAASGGREFHLPDPGEGLTEATITSWKVAEGDQVKVNDIIVEIETAKSLVELPSPWTGTVTSILVPEGTEVEVGTPIIVIDDGSAAAATAPTAPAPAAAEEEDGSGANLVGYGSKPGSSARRARKSAPGAAQAQQAANASLAGLNIAAAAPAVDQAVESAPAELATPAPSQPVAGRGDVKALAKPPVRKLAKDHGIDLTTVSGSGEGGVITRADVEAAIGGQAQAQPAPTAAAPEAAAAAPARAALADRREPIKGVRKVTAKAMVDSAFQKVHVTEWVDVDVTKTMELLDTLKARREWREKKVSPLLVWAKAVTTALRRHPSINASWDEAAQEIVYHGDVNLGIAAATPRGLMVPNIKGAQDLDLAGLNDAIADLIKVARDGKLQPADYAQGTFTITNVGVFGVDAGTPIINGNESAILAMGSITRKPWVVGEGADERIEPRWVTTMALSFDHRLIDGEQGSKFLRDVADLLANPELALLY